MLDSEQVQRIGHKTEKLAAKLTSTNGKQPKVPAVAVGLSNANETVFSSYHGVLDLKSQVPVDEDSIYAFFSLTKTMTAFAALKLVEQNKIRLDDETRKYVPEIDDIYIVDKGTVDAKTGEFTVPPRKPTKKVTIQHLLTMMAGMSYPFLNEEYNLLARLKNPHINSGVPSRQLFTTEKLPLITEPGEEFSYGHSLDWMGWIVENVTGQTLGQFLGQELFGPGGMTSCTFHVKSTAKLVRLHRRTSKGDLVFFPQGVALDPAVDMGGQGCFGTINDYLKLLRVWLNYGYSPDGQVRVLDESLARHALQNHLPAGCTVKFDIPGLPKTTDGFTLAGMAITVDEAPTGRPEGSLYWSGLGNLYYWLDPKNQVAGIWASQVLPMADPQSFLGYCKYEMSVYDTINGEEDDEEEEEDEEEPAPKL